MEMEIEDEIEKTPRKKPRQDPLNIKTHIFPAEFSLFKGFKLGIPPTPLQNTYPTFFGLKNLDKNYIEEYEEMYGIIYEFKTTKEYRLLALDDNYTLQTIYDEAPSNIRKIIMERYGLGTGLRDSQSEDDKKLSNYICEKGYDGYAILNMNTFAGGKFHTELLICDISNIELVGQITTNEKKSEIIQYQNLKLHQEEQKEKRKKQKVMDLNQTPPPSMSKSLFGFDSPPSSPLHSASLYSQSSPPDYQFQTPPRPGTLPRIASEWDSPETSRPLSPLHSASLSSYSTPKKTGGKQLKKIKQLKTGKQLKKINKKKTKKSFFDLFF